MTTPTPPAGMRFREYKGVTYRPSSGGAMAYFLFEGHAHKTASHIIVENRQFTDDDHAPLMALKANPLEPAPPAAAEEPVQRYDLVGEYDMVAMAPLSDGDYVLYSDYAALAAARPAVDHSGDANKMVEALATTEPMHDSRPVVVMGQAQYDPLLREVQAIQHVATREGECPSFDVTASVADLAQQNTTLAARVAELEAENVAERQKFADHASKIIDATGVEVPANGMTALEAVAALQQRVAAVERERKALRQAHEYLERAVRGVMGGSSADTFANVLSPLQYSVVSAIATAWTAALAAAAPAATQQTNGDQSNG